MRNRPPLCACRHGPNGGHFETHPPPGAACHDPNGGPKGGSPRARMGGLHSSCRHGRHGRQRGGLPSEPCHRSPKGPFPGPAGEMFGVFRGYLLFPEGAVPRPRRGEFWRFYVLFPGVFPLSRSPKGPFPGPAGEILAFPGVILRRVALCFPFVPPVFSLVPRVPFVPLCSLVPLCYPVVSRCLPFVYPSRCLPFTLVFRNLRGARSAPREMFSNSEPLETPKVSRRAERAEKICLIFSSLPRKPPASPGHGNGDPPRCLPPRP